MNRADEWRAKGAYFSWSPRDEPATALEIFHVEVGDVAAPALVLVHGFPTSSIDWIGIAELLSERYRVCALDFPGYGFSDKPLDWGYSLRRDAELLEALAALEVPTTLIWGLCDKVAPPRVASYVWNHYMMLKPGRNCLYFLPDADHYLQNDRPDALVETILHALDAPLSTPPGPIAQRPASPLLVDRSRTGLPRAADLLKKPA